MYRVNVLSDGCHHNIIFGARYCFRRKTAAGLAELFLKDKCDVTIEKLVHSRGVFFWSDDEEDTKIHIEWGDDGLYVEGFN